MGQDDDLPAGREAPIWVASLYPPRKYINILMENLYYAIGLFYIEKLRALPQCPIPLSFLLLGDKVLHILNSFFSTTCITIDIIDIRITTYAFHFIILLIIIFQITPHTLGSRYL